MQSFTFHNPTRIIFGEGQIVVLDAHIPPNALVLITSGGGSIRSNGVLVLTLRSQGLGAEHDWSAVALCALSDAGMSSALQGG